MISIIPSPYSLSTTTRTQKATPHFQGSPNPAKVTQDDRDRWYQLFEIGRSKEVFDEVEQRTGIRIHWPFDYGKDFYKTAPTIGLITTLLNNPNHPRLEAAKHVVLGDACPSMTGNVFREGFARGEAIDVQEYINSIAPEGTKVAVLAPLNGDRTSFNVDYDTVHFFTAEAATA